MPAIIRGNTLSQRKHVDFSTVSYDYVYPDDLDLRPGSKLHDRIRDAVLERANESYSRISQRHDNWDKIDRSLTAYIPPTEKEEKETKFKTTPVIVPVTYATLETLLTYYVAAFLQNPIFRYEGSGPSDIAGAALMEALIDLHVRRLGVGINLHTMYRDAIAYGFGAVAPIWKVKRGKKAVIKDETLFSSLLSKIVGTGRSVREAVDAILFEGNALVNIDTRRYLPDPNTSISDVQEGEFSGWVESSNIMDLLDDEKNDSDIFNVLYLKHISDGRSYTIRGATSSDSREKGLTSSSSTNVTKPFDVINLFIKIIPKEWELGDSEYPEKWKFSVAADEVVISAKPVGLNHGDFPIVVASPDSDGYSVTPTSKLEVVYGLQDSIDWLFQSHVANVRKAINDMFIVDPAVVNVKDLMSPRPGKFVRLRKSYWGRGLIDKGVMQMKVNDVTQSHMRDTAIITDIIRTTTGAVDIVQGLMRKGGERRSATEARDVRTAALSRLEKSAKIMSMQAMQKIAYMFASHTQQLMSDDAYAKASDDWEDVLVKELNVDRGRVKISPKDIIVDYDIVPHDGSIPGGEPADLWIQLFQVMGGQPELLKNFDVVRIFKHVARQLGAKNVNDFVRRGGGINTKVVPDETVEKEVDKGNLVPVEQ